MAKAPRAVHPRLNEEQKNFATLCFARFMRPLQVVEAVQERYGITIDRRVIQMFDPTTVRGAELGTKRKQLWAQCREAFLKELNGIPIANRAVRLHQLQTAFDKSIDKGATGFALKILEQAAKEAGGTFTSERTVTLAGRVEVETVSEDEMRNGLAAAIASALEAERERLDPASATKH